MAVKAEAEQKAKAKTEAKVKAMASGGAQINWLDATRDGICHGCARTFFFFEIAC